MTIFFAAMIPAATPFGVLAMDSLVDNSQLAAPTMSGEFDWDGFYTGVFGVVQTGGAGVGVNLGVNARIEFVLVGAEVSVQGLSDGTETGAYVQALGRAGLAATDELILFGAGGLGMEASASGGADALLGAGVELSLTENLSLRGQYLHGFDLSGTESKDQVSVGANFHF